MEELHTVARKLFKPWIASDRETHGPLFEYEKPANASFKYALQCIKRNEETQ